MSSGKKEYTSENRSSKSGEYTDDEDEKKKPLSPRKPLSTSKAVSSDSDSVEYTDDEKKKQPPHLKSATKAVQKAVSSDSVEYTDNEKKKQPPPRKSISNTKADHVRKHKRRSPEYTDDEMKRPLLPRKPFFTIKTVQKAVSSHSVEYTDDEKKKKSPPQKSPNVRSSSKSDGDSDASSFHRLSEFSSDGNEDDEDDDDEDLMYPPNFKRGPPPPQKEETPFCLTQKPVDPVVTFQPPAKLCITKAKQKILACAKDLCISENNEIRYSDLQKIYLRKYGSPLDKTELFHLFGTLNATQTLHEGFSIYFDLTTDKNKGILLRMKGDIKECLNELENNKYYGKLDPIPELSSMEIADVLRPASQIDPLIRTATSLSHTLSARVVASLRARGFARENFEDLPRVRNPIIRTRNDDNSEDVFTDEENMLPKTSPQSISRAPRRRLLPSNLRSQRSINECYQNDDSSPSAKKSLPNETECQQNGSLKLEMLRINPASSQQVKPKLHIVEEESSVKAASSFPEGQTLCKNGGNTAFQEPMFIENQKLQLRDYEDSANEDDYSFKFCVDMNSVVFKTHQDYQDFTFEHPTDECNQPLSVEKVINDQLQQNHSVLPSYDIFANLSEDAVKSELSKCGDGYYEYFNCKRSEIQDQFAKQLKEAREDKEKAYQIADEFYELKSNSESEIITIKTHFNYPEFLFYPPLKSVSDKNASSNESSTKEKRDHLYQMADKLYEFAVAQITQNKNDQEEKILSNAAFHLYNNTEGF